MSKAEDEDFFGGLIAGATPVARGDNSKVPTVDVPDNVVAHVALLCDSAEGAILPVTDDDGFSRVRIMYINAARRIGRSATVMKSYQVVKDSTGAETSREWVGTRVSIGVKRGAQPRNGGSTESPAADPVTTGW